MRSCRPEMSRQAYAPPTSCWRRCGKGGARASRPRNARLSDLNLSKNWRRYELAFSARAIGARALERTALRNMRAQGMPGEGLTHGPTAKQNAGGSHHWFSQIIRHSVRDGFNGVLRALPGDRAFLPPSPASFVTLRVSLSVRRPGPHDFSIRDVISRPRKGCALTPSHPASRVVTIAHTSLLPRRDGRKDHIIPKNRIKIFFANCLDSRDRDPADLWQFYIQLTEVECSMGLILSSPSSLIACTSRCGRD
jgi:hypothetical protein